VPIPRFQYAWRPGRWPPRRRAGQGTVVAVSDGARGPCLQSSLGPGRLDRTISTMICISVCQITIGVAIAAAAESCSESNLLAASRLELAAWPARRVACGFPPGARRVTADRLAVTMTAPPQRQVPAGPPPLVPGPLGFAAGPCRGASPVSSGMSVQR
jgi:hypothetical protein